MTTQKIKFYKFNSSTGDSASKITTAKGVEGAIIYLVDVNELWIGGTTPKLVLKGANDVTFAGNILTVTHYDNNGTPTPQRLDFNDVASAEQTFKVFENVYGLIGSTPSGTQQTLDYSGTQYIQGAQSLVAADKILDGKIYENSIMGVQSSAVYDTQHLSSTWTEVVNANAIQGNNTVRDSVEKVDKKVAQLANEVINNEEVTQQAFSAVANSVGLESDMSLDLTSTSLHTIINDTSVKEALIDLDAALHTITSDAVKDVKINGTSIVNSQEANIAVDGTYNATDNKIATKSTVTDAINALDVAENKGAASISGSTITINAVQQENGLIKDGGSTTINLEGTYNETTNKIATQSTISNAIDAMAGAGLAVNAAGAITATTQNTDDTTTNVATTAFVHNVVGTLDTSSDVQAVDYTAADASNGAKLTFKGVSETDGKIAQGSGTTQLQFAKVATTGTAADVAVVDSHSKYTASNLEDVLYEIAQSIDSLVGGMRYNGNIDSTTATLNTSTHDIRPGDIYLASGAFTLDGTSVEAGDMIVYKGQKSQTTVTLDSSNCTIIEKETDTMVTAGGTLADDYIVFGNGNKEVTTTSNDSYTITASQLNTAITNANSALQSIIRGTDGTYVTTTVGAKTNNSQSVGVALTYGTVTYSAKDGDTPANLTVTSGNEGVLNTNAITPIKNYVDEKVSNVVSDLDVDEYAQASVVVDTTNHASTLKIKGIQETDGKIAAATTTPTTDVAIDGEYNETNNKLATKSTVTNAINNLDKSASTVTGTNVSVNYSEADGIVTVNSVSESYATITRTAKASGVTPNLVVTSGDGSKLVKASDIANTKLYTDDKIADEIEKLHANVTSNNAAVATVQVVETDGKVTAVNVANVSAGVSYTQSTASSAPNLTATTDTGAVTGADIDTIKSYVDDKSAMCWEEYE